MHQEPGYAGYAGYPTAPEYHLINAAGEWDPEGAAGDAMADTAGCHPEAQKVRAGVSLARGVAEAFDVRGRVPGVVHGDGAQRDEPTAADSHGLSEPSGCDGMRLLVEEVESHSIECMEEEKMPYTVALDIETTGLDRYVDLITIVALHGNLDNTDKVSSRVFNFLRSTDEGTLQNDVDEIKFYLNRAKRITCFNGTRFDIPFLQVFCGYDNITVSTWILKMFDIFDISKFILRQTFKLDTLLRFNGHETKSASGLEAIEWAKDPAKWPMLEAYGLQDTKLTYEIGQARLIKLPVRHSDGFYCILQKNGYFRISVTS